MVGWANWRNSISASSAGCLLLLYHNSVKTFLLCFQTYLLTCLLTLDATALGEPYSSTFPKNPFPRQQALIHWGKAFPERFVGMQVGNWTGKPAKISAAAKELQCTEHKITTLAFTIFCRFPQLKAKVWLHGSQLYTRKQGKELVAMHWHKL